MKCPNCKLINPSDALQCDCGYDFRAAPGNQPDCKIPRRRFPSLWHFLLAYFMGCCGCGKIALLPHFWLSGTAFFAIGYLAWFGVSPMDPPPILILPALAPPVFLVAYGAAKRSVIAFAAFTVILILNVGGCRMWPEGIQHRLEEKREGAIIQKLQEEEGRE